MCQYRYDYYGYCQHQEFILVKLCEDAISLARVDKHQTEHNAEGTIVQAPPADTTTAALYEAESNLCTTEPSIVLIGEVEHSIYSLSTITHIIVRFVAPCLCAFHILVLTYYSTMAPPDTPQTRLVPLVFSQYCAKDTDPQAATMSKSLPRKLNAITTISSAAESLLHTTKPSRSNCCKSLTECASSQTLALRQLSDSNSFMSTTTNLQTKQPRSLLQPLSLYLSTISLRCLTRLSLAMMS
jgi:hypothetical protein